MKVIEINEGSKIPYEVSKTKICFDDDLTINLAKRQEDWPVHIDILTDGDGVLVTGAESGNYYVAQIDIPAREYKEPEATEEAATVEDGGEHAGTTDTPQPEPLPLDMEKVTLTLWALVNYEA
jgi:hypothetical protein